MKILMATDYYDLDFLSPLTAKKTLENVYNKKLKCPVLFKYIIDKVAIIKMPTKGEYREEEYSWCHMGGLYLVSYHIKMRPSKNTCQPKRKITPPIIEKQIRALHAKLSEKERKIEFRFIPDGTEEVDVIHNSYYTVKLMDPTGDEVPLNFNIDSIQFLFDRQITKNGLLRKTYIRGAIEHGVFDLKKAMQPEA